MRSDALDALVLHLQASDLPIAVDTVLRLRVLFTQTDLPEDPARVASMVAALVARQPTEFDAAKRATLAWLQSAPTPEGITTAEVPTFEPPPADAAKTAQGFGRAMSVVGAIGLTAVMVWLALASEPPVPSPRDAAIAADASVPDAAVPSAPQTDAPKSKIEFLETAPKLEIMVQRALPTNRTTWPFWALAFFGFATALYGWRRTRPPGQPVPPPGPNVPPRRERRAPSRTPRFITGRDADTLAWGIDRYLSDEPTGRLDLKATVAATVAAAGAPKLEWAQAQRHRELWLWIDDAATRAHPEISQIVKEVQMALARVGLQPKVAHFWGVPDTLSYDDTPLRVDQIEDMRASARVAVLTDGRLWTRWRSEPARRLDAERALRRLANWRHLAVFDFADGEWPMAELLRRAGVEMRTPAELVGWLGEFDTRAGEATDDDRMAWAAACALCPEPVSEDDALALLQALAPAGVEASPWTITELRAEAPGPGRRLRWDGGKTADLVTWLGQAEAGENSLLTRARGFWKARLSGDDPRRVAQRAWLDLFAQPTDGEGELERGLSTLLPLTHADDDGHVPVAVGERVAHALPMDLAGPGVIELPWKWADLDLYSRLRARAIGLGRAVGGLPEEQVVRPGRVGLATGLGVGVAIAAIVMALLPDTAVDPGLPVVISNAVGAEVRYSPTAVAARTPWDDVLVEGLKPGARVRIVEDTQACQTRDENQLIVRCGTIQRPRQVNRSVTGIGIENGKPISFLLEPSVAVIEADPDAPAQWGQLAAALLDTGSVDTVFVAPAVPEDRLAAWVDMTARGVFFTSRAFGPKYEPIAPEGWAIISGDLDRSAQALGTEAPGALTLIWPDAIVTETAPRVRVDWPRRVCSTATNEADQLSSKASNAVGLRALEAEEFDDAIEAFTAAVHADKCALLAWYNLACVLSRDGQFAASRRVLVKLASAPDCTGCQVRVARAAQDTDFKAQWDDPAFQAIVKPAYVPDHSLEQAVEAVNAFVQGAGDLEAYVDPRRTVTITTHAVQAKTKRELKVVGAQVDETLKTLMNGRSAYPMRQGKCAAGCCTDAWVKKVSERLYVKKVCAEADASGWLTIRSIDLLRGEK